MHVEYTNVHTCTRIDEHARTNEPTTTTYDQLQPQATPVVRVAAPLAPRRPSHVPRTSVRDTCVKFGFALEETYDFGTVKLVCKCAVHL